MIVTLLHGLFAAAARFGCVGAVVRMWWCAVNLLRIGELSRKHGDLRRIEERIQFLSNLFWV